MRSAKDYMGPSEASFDSPFLPMPLKRHRTLQRLAAARCVEPLVVAPRHESSPNPSGQVHSHKIIITPSSHLVWTQGHSKPLPRASQHEP